MLPFLEVAHLPSSSSFYSAVIQPLGLRYISNPGQDLSPSVTYGLSQPRTPVFQLRQVANPKPSRIVLTAQSPTAVADFHRYALRASPDLVPSAATILGGTEPTETQESRAKVLDFDGNTMEVVYCPPPPDHPSRYGGSTVRKTQSTSAEADRILDWNYGVAVLDTPSTIRTRAPHPRYAGDDEPYKVLRRAVTTNSVAYDTADPPHQIPSGLSTGTVMGTLLGVAAGAAAGAAITYSMVKNDRARAPQQEFDAPAFTRRSTFPDAPFSTDRSPRYVEVERTVEKVRYPHDYPSGDTRRALPEYIARYSQAGGSTKGTAREVDHLYDDTRSRHSRTSGSVRTRSEAATAQRPLLITETEHRSYVGSSSSRHGKTPPVTRSPMHRSNTFDVSDRESYASARSQRTNSTIRPPPLPFAPSATSPVMERSRAGSRVTTTTVKMPSQRHVPDAHSFSRAGSYMSARNVPLPASAMGSSHSDWDEDDGGSVVPEDSISCVGSRKSGRSYYG